MNLQSQRDQALSRFDVPYDRSNERNLVPYLQTPLSRVRRPLMYDSRDEDGNESQSIGTSKSFSRSSLGSSSNRSFNGSSRPGTRPLYPLSRNEMNRIVNRTSAPISSSTSSYLSSSPSYSPYRPSSSSVSSREGLSTVYPRNSSSSIHSSRSSSILNRNSISRPFNNNVGHSTLRITRIPELTDDEIEHLINTSRSSRPTLSSPRVVQSRVGNSRIGNSRIGNSRVIHSRGTEQEMNYDRDPIRFSSLNRSRTSSPSSPFLSSSSPSSYSRSPGLLFSSSPVRSSSASPHPSYQDPSRSMYPSSQSSSSNQANYLVTRRIPEIDLSQLDM